MIADDEQSVVDVLDALISGEPDLELVGSARDADAAITLAEAEQPDVALLDVRMPGGGGLRAAREITRRCPPTAVIALSAHEDQETVIAMMDAGANAYVPKGDSTDRILREIHRRANRASLRRAWRDHGSRRSPVARKREQRQRILEVLERHAIKAVFQPIFDLETGRLAGVEALARFARLPVRAPDAWFEEADTAGLLLEVEIEAVRTAMEALHSIPRTAFLAVNVSPSTVVSDGFADVLEGANLERMVLELTEHAVVSDYGELIAALEPLREAGLRLAVDDVGAGTSSLRHVVMLSPDIMKIDTSLTAGVERDDARHAVVAALAACARQLGARSVAEGIELRDQLEALMQLGVELAQGFLLAEPESLGELASRDIFGAARRRADTSKRFRPYGSARMRAGS
jgi:EAL domain-containing protein (putative c-di-GMP-specific phosphodiesterase class I)